MEALQKNRFSATTNNNNFNNNNSSNSNNIGLECVKESRFKFSERGENIRFRTKIASRQFCES